MAIAFDAATNGNYNGGSANNVTFSHTCTGSDLILLVGIYATSLNTTGVTYNGVSMTEIGTAFAIGSDNLSAWYLVNPATGANNVVATLSGTGGGQGGSLSYTGASQTGQPDANNTTSGSGTSLTNTLSTVADNSWRAIYAHWSAGGTIVAGTNSTKRGSANTNEGWFDSNGPITPAGSFAMTVDNSTGGSYGAFGLSIKLSTGGAATVTRSPSGGASYGSPMMY